VLRLDGLEVHVLAPDSAWTAVQRSGNDASVVLRVVHGAVSFLLTGDAEAAEEAVLLDRARPSLRATVLKVGHHGSATSTTPAFLAAVAPRLALVSVGADNRYGHPHPDVLRSLRAAGVPVLRTDRDGAIVVRSDGRRLTVVSRRDRFGVDVLAPRSPP
jgi:competence protein ComEC